MTSSLSDASRCVTEFHDAEVSMIVLLEILSRQYYILIYTHCWEGDGVSGHKWQLVAAICDEGACLVICE
jgi:hypothetical protein